MATALRSILRHVVQTSPDFSTWTTHTAIRCDECSEGAGQVVGHASLLAFIGTGRIPGATGAVGTMSPITGLVGTWCRVLIEDAGGAITISGVNYAALWHGIIDAEELTDEGGGVGTQRWTCAGLAAHLGRIGCMEAWSDAVDYTGAYSAIPTLRVPTFNDRDSQGIRAGSRTGSVDGATVKIFDCFGATAWNAATPWSAAEALAMLLAANGRYRTPGTTTFNGGVTFALSAGTLLDWTLPTLDVNGMTLLDAINAIISPRRGLTWRMTVSGTTATINVRSIAASAITVGSTTLPAATDTATPTLTGLWVQGVRMIENQTDTYDHIRVIGNRPWVVASLSYDPDGPAAEMGSLQPAWTSTQQTAWGTAPDSTTDGVYRSFRLGLKWAGDNAESAGAAGIRQSLTVTSGDFTGARAFSGTAPACVALITLDPRLPCSEGWGTDKAGPRQDCMAFWMPSGTTDWYDLQSDGSPWSRSISVEDCPAAIHVGNATRNSIDKNKSDQAINNAIISTAGKLLVTIGLHEPDPLVVSWTRASASWPRSNPRTLTVQMPQAEQWVILDETVKGVASKALVKHSTGDTTIRDDVPLMQSWLAFLRAYFAEPARALSWTDRGSIDYAYGSGACAPGALVTSATLGTGSTTINAVVTRRTWRLAENGYGTSYQTDRIVPDIEAIR